MPKLLAIIIAVLMAIAVLLAVDSSLEANTEKKGQIMDEEKEIVCSASGLNITVVYDNNPCKEGLSTAWGFSCRIAGVPTSQKNREKASSGTEKTILFDTGGDGSLLLSNMKKLTIEPNSIDIVVLSHIHGDHTGGLDNFLEENPNVTVYLPASFPMRFKNEVLGYGAKIVEVQQPLKICENVYSTGQLGRLIKEQALIIKTDKGVVIITGCAHPGIVNMVSTAKDFLKDDILLVMGGFHLEWASRGKIEKIISAFRQSHVRYVGPCHCTGDKARSLFEKHFGKNYINIGVGKIINIGDLQ